MRICADEGYEGRIMDMDILVWVRGLVEFMDMVLDFVCCNENVLNDANRQLSMLVGHVIRT